jgi:hypothetical protein
MILSLSYGANYLSVSEIHHSSFPRLASFVYNFDPRQLFKTPQVTQYTTQTEWP